MPKEDRPDRPERAERTVKLVLVQPTRAAGHSLPAGTTLAEVRILAGTPAELDKAIIAGRARIAL